MTRLTNANSVEVLDSAERMEDRLNWMLFCMEQERQLWSDPDDWKPGDPIHPHPHLNTFNTFTIRPMFEVFSDGNPAQLPDCKDCGVCWDTYETLECWMCGNEVEGPGYAFGGFFEPSMAVNPGAYIDFHIQFDMEAWRASMRRANEALWQMQSEMVSASRAIRGMNLSLFRQEMVLDECDSSLFVKPVPEETCEEVEFDFKNYFLEPWAAYHMPDVPRYEMPEETVKYPEFTFSLYEGEPEWMSRPQAVRTGPPRNNHRL